MLDQSITSATRWCTAGVISSKRKDANQVIRRWTRSRHTQAGAAEHGAGDAAASAPRRGGHISACTPAPSDHPGAGGRKQRQEDECARGGVGGEGEGGGGGARVLRGREPARPGGGGAADRGGVRVRGPGVPAAHGGAGPGGGLLRRLHGLRQPRPPLRHRRHLRRGSLRRRRHLAPRVEGAAVPVQPGMQLLPVPARPAAAGADSDRVRPGLRGAGDQTRRVGAGGHQGSDVAARALSEPCRQALTSLQWIDGLQIHSPASSCMRLRFRKNKYMRVLNFRCINNLQSFQFYST